MLDFRDLESINMLNFQPNQIKAEISNDLVNKSQTSANIKRCVSVCKGCGQEIYDQYILRVAPDLEWHAACLKCVDCQEYLDERCTCYVKETKVYCKADYLRHFSPKCFKCQQAIKPMDYVTRVRNQRIYHVNCFHCVVCLRLLLPGEEFVLRGDNILCKSDSEELDKTEALSHVGFVDFADDSIIGPQSLFGAAVGRGQLTPLRNNNSETPPLNSLSQSPCNNSNNNRSNSPPIVIAEHPSISGSNSSPGSDQTATNSSLCHQQQQHNNNNNISGGYGGRVGAHQILSSPPPSSHHHHHKKEKKDKPKTTRVRTVLNEKQLHTLRSIYGANPRPDALMKEQLVEMTGLSPRVIRVWFQNKRCKDKKRQIALKQMQQQQEKNQALNSIRLHGVGPLIAGAPGRLDMPPMMQALDVHQFQQNSAIWKQGGPPPPPGLHGLITDFGSPTGMLRGGPPPPEAMMVGLDGQTPFQQLLHGFGDPSMDPGNMGYIPSSIAYANSMNSDLRSISPQLVASDLSSPSCSE